VPVARLEAAGRHKSSRREKREDALARGGRRGGGRAYRVGSGGLKG